MRNATMRAWGGIALAGVVLLTIALKGWLEGLAWAGTGTLQSLGGIAAWPVLGMATWAAIALTPQTETPQEPSGLWRWVPWLLPGVATLTAAGHFGGTLLVGALLVASIAVWRRIGRGARLRQASRGSAEFMLAVGPALAVSVGAGLLVVATVTSGEAMAIDAASELGPWWISVVVIVLYLPFWASRLHGDDRASASEQAFTFATLLVAASPVIVAAFTTSDDAVAVAGLLAAGIALPGFEWQRRRARGAGRAGLPDSN